MPKAAYCSECGENVYLAASGTCPKGHGAEALSNHYDAPEPGPIEEPVAVPVPDTPPPTTAKSKLPLIIGIVIVVVLLCGCGSLVAGVWFLDDSDSGSTENPLTDEESAAVDEMNETLAGGYGNARADAEGMVTYFYPDFRFHELAEASDPAEAVDYHIVAESESVPGFYITFFATRTEDIEAEGSDDPATSYYDEEAGVLWLHPQTQTSGLAAFIGPNPLAPASMSEQIMSDFLDMRREPLFMTEYNMASNIEISIEGIGENDLEDWFDDFTTWESGWANDLQSGTWIETSFEYTD